MPPLRLVQAVRSPQNQKMSQSHLHHNNGSQLQKNKMTIVPILIEYSTKIKHGFKLKLNVDNGVVSSPLFVIELKMTELPNSLFQPLESTGLERMTEKQKVVGYGTMVKLWITVSLPCQPLTIMTAAAFQTGGRGMMTPV
jgi:hypothetical protein